MSEAPAPASVLVVDDTPANVAALEAILGELEGVELVTAASGREALRALMEREVALILMDVRMDGMDGIETARLIRSRPRTARVPIIFVTAFDRAELDMSAAYEVQAADFIFKPFQPEALRAKVSVFIDLHRTSEEVREQAERLRMLEQREHRRQLEQSERRRLAAERAFEGILDVAPDGVISAGADGRVVLFNHGAEAMFGVSADDVVGGPLGALFETPPDFARSGPAVDLVGLRPGGERFPAEVTVAKLDLVEGAVTTLFCRDVTERRQAEARVRDLNVQLRQRLSAGVQMVADLAATLDPSEVLGRVLRRTVDAVAADRALIVLTGEDGRMTVADAHQADGGEPPARGTDLSSVGVLRRALADRQPVLNGALGAKGLDAASSRWLASVRWSAALPIGPADAADGVEALLLLGRDHDEAFGSGDVEILHLIGNVAAAAMRNARLFVQAEAASISKSEFLNMAAHELRTPLSVVIGYLSMLADGSLGEPGPVWMRPVEIMQSKAGELGQLVDALLMAARMEAGTVRGQPVACDLAALAREAMHRAEPRAQMLDATLLLDAPAEPVVVEADPGHLARVLDNLVNNALTYTMERPWVKVTVRESGEVVVEDHGLGIPDDRREIVFERFYRVNDPALPPQPGTGLGLYISRELAQRYGGDLALTASAPGHGSTFTLALPLQPPGTVPVAHPTAGPATAI